MDLFYAIAVSAIVLLLATCTYCLSLAVLRNVATPETAYLQFVCTITRKLTIVGGIILLAFCIWSAVLLVAATYSA